MDQVVDMKPFIRLVHRSWADTIWEIFDDPRLAFPVGCGGWWAARAGLGWLVGACLRLLDRLAGSKGDLDLRTDLQHHLKRDVLSSCWPQYMKARDFGVSLEWLSNSCWKIDVFCKQGRVASMPVGFWLGESQRLQRKVQLKSKAGHRSRG